MVGIYDLILNEYDLGGKVLFIKELNHMLKKLSSTKWHIIAKSKFPSHSSPLVPFPLTIQISLKFLNA